MLKPISLLIRDLTNIGNEVERFKIRISDLEEKEKAFAKEKEKAKGISKEIEEGKVELSKIKAEKEVVIRQTEDRISQSKSNLENILNTARKEKQKIDDEIEKLKADNKFYFDATKEKELEISKKLDALNEKEVSFRDREKVIAEKEVKISQLEGDSLKKNNRLLAENLDIDILKDQLQHNINKTRAKQEELGTVMEAYKGMKSNHESLMAESKEGIANAKDLKEQASAIIAEYEAKLEAFDKKVEAKNKELEEQAWANNLKSVELEALERELKEERASVLVETRKLNKIKEQLSK